jgi:16S rRNA (guanine1516-N2)-methyltransferase
MGACGPTLQEHGWMKPIAVAVDSADPDAPDRARLLAERLGLPLVSPAAGGAALLLVVADGRLELREVAEPTGPVFADFVRGRTAARHRQPGLAGDPLIRALGARERACTVLDATAGLGRDAFLMAAAGACVTAVERSVVLAALLQDGLERAARDPVAGPIIRERLRLVADDARTVLAALPPAGRPDVVYIDPMFPNRSKSALSKKEMRICRIVAGEDPDAGDLFAVARQVASRRVVVKRWLRASPLGERPDIQYRGQSIRYDVYLARNPSPG